MSETCESERDLRDGHGEPVVCRSCYREALDRADAAAQEGTKEMLRYAFADDEHKDELCAKLQAALEAVDQFRAWADGYAHPETGMGSGLHAEMWPLLVPSAWRRMLEIVEMADRKVGR